MAEYIDREKLLEIIAISKCDSRKITCDKCDEKAFCIYGVVENFPAEDVAPVIRAKWIHYNLDLGDSPTDAVYCSNCGYDDGVNEDDNYCSNCGAKMDLK